MVRICWSYILFKEAGKGTITAIPNSSLSLPEVSPLSELWETLTLASHTHFLITPGFPRSLTAYFRNITKAGSITQCQGCFRQCLPTVYFFTSCIVRLEFHKTDSRCVFANTTICTGILWNEALLTNRRWRFKNRFPVVINICCNFLSSTKLDKWVWC